MSGRPTTAEEWKAVYTERSHIKARVEALLPGWLVTHVNEHSAYARHDGKPIEDEKGQWITVDGWVCVLTNPNGYSAYTHSFADPEYIAEYAREHWANRKPHAD